jgi:shikimate kinase
MKHLVLVGLMGAGKSSVGRVCAERLGRDFVDTDTLVEQQVGLSVDEIFRRDGEAGFRELERNVIADVCASPAPLVVACGGGAVLDPENRRALRGAGVVVWLRAPAATLAARVGAGSTRPLLRNDPEGALRRLEQLREPQYESAAHLSVSTDGIAVETVADTVLARFDEAAA